MKTYADWEFPLTRTHCGMLLGNARMGVMIWGERNSLKVTLGRADLWDHRGGMEWSDKHTFQNIRTLLETNDETGMKALFAETIKARPGQPPIPTIIGIGHIEFIFPEEYTLISGRLFFESGNIILTARTAEETFEIKCELAIREDLLTIEFPKQLRKNIKITNHPVMEFIGETLRVRLSEMM